MTKIKLKLSVFSLLIVSFLVLSCKDSLKQSATEDAKFSIEFEKYELANGLDVILHQDKSDPIVSVAIQYGVGSNREKTGRTGFAHLFEHMLFQESENVPQDQFFKKIQDLGGTLNGGTWKDGTVYYEVVPNNALETVLWLESDRMLALNINEKSLSVQQGVVIEEFKQRYLNQPYGDVWLLLRPLAFDVHPYKWATIGKQISHIEEATMQDKKDMSKYKNDTDKCIAMWKAYCTDSEGEKIPEGFLGRIKDRDSNIMNAIILGFFVQAVPGPVTQK